MLKIKCKQLRLSSKGNLKRFICNGIPVLSIFALVGILGISLITTSNNINISNSNSSPNNSLISNLANLFFLAEEAYAADEVIGDSTASITISGSASDETVSAGRGSTVYRTHTISIAGNNVKNYILSIYGDSKLSYVENSTTGQLSTTEYLSNANGASGSNLPTNTWGYAYSSNSTSSTSTDNANLTYTAPTTNAVTLASGNIPTSSNGVLNITNNKLVFAAKFDEDKPSGNYKANVNLALTITPRVLTTYSITYDCKSGTGCPSNYTENLYEETKTYTIPTTTPTRSGYKFLGYSTNSSATTADANYAPGKAISLTQASPSVKLYAVWEEEFRNFPTTLTTMQGMTSEICDAATIGATATLTDNRNPSVSYTIRKHEDGNCWMTQNLRLINTTISPADSNVVSNFTVPASSKSGFTAHDNLAAFYDANQMGYGAYYSWFTATVGSGTKNVSTGEVTQSICPRNWVLPSSGDYNKLASSIGATKDSAGSALLRNSTYNFQLAGSLYTTLDSAGTEGTYWTRTAYSGTHAFRFYIMKDTYGVTANVKFVGMSIRCVAYSS